MKMPRTLDHDSVYTQFVLLDRNHFSLQISREAQVNLMISPFLRKTFYNCADSSFGWRQREYYSSLPLESNSRV